MNAMNESLAGRLPTAERGGLPPEGVMDAAHAVAAHTMLSQITRAQVLERAQSWIDEHMMYSQTSVHKNRFGSYRQDWVSDVRIRKQPTRTSEIVATLAGPTTVEVRCQVHGDKARPKHHQRRLSFLPHDGGYVSNIYIDHPAAWLPGVPSC